GVGGGGDRGRGAGGVARAARPLAAGRPPSPSPGTRPRGGGGGGAPAPDRCRTRLEGSSGPAGGDLMAGSVFTIPAGRPFLDDLARGLLAEAGPDPLDLARTLVLLPTRRACRAARDAFLRVSGG